MNAAAICDKCRPTVYGCSCYVGDERFKREGCECDRRGLTEGSECVYADPCPAHDVAPREGVA